MSENSICPTCGSTGAKRWRTVSGLELCDECAFDFLCDLNGRKMMDARAAIGEPPYAHEERTGARRSENPGNETNPPRPGAHAGTTQPSPRGPKGGSPIPVTRHPDYPSYPKVRRWPRKPLDAATQARLHKLLTPSSNSLCLLCGHLFHHAAMSACSRCGGLCVQRSDGDLRLMTRRPTLLVEKEQ